LACIVERYVQVRTDKHALALDFALGAQVRKADDIHGVSLQVLERGEKLAPIVGG